MSAQNRGDLKGDFLLFLVLLSLVFVLTPLLAGIGAPKALWLGFAFVAGIALLILSRRLVSRGSQRLVDRLQKKLQDQPRPVRVATVGEKIFSSGLVTLIAALALLLAYVFHWDSKWYAIALAGWMGGIAVTWLANGSARTDERSDG